MSSVNCEYCGTNFVKKCNLYKHQRTAKYCLRIQGTKERYSCTFCERDFSRSDALKRHQIGCSARDVRDKLRDEQNTQLLDMIAQLQRTIEHLSQNQGTGNTVNRNNVVLQNMAPITDEDIQEHLEHLTLNFIQDGAKGYADFAGKYPFKDRLLCTDRARKKLKYKDGNGEVIEDGGGAKLAQRFFQVIAPRNEEIINTEYRALHEQVQQIATDGTAYRADLTGLLTKATKLQSLLISCQEAARGEENELTKEFVHHLTNML
uniref:C2H2-type domain-containing protein n=1 Tax=Marseillevirus LCMAC202 TaxID=2506606 RepID=A0A481YZ26_9VIRU|nr:MAG: hypothetical protein LCMAC202_05330 [Marseillevirus LCMAC202]